MTVIFCVIHVAFLSRSLYIQFVIMTRAIFMVVPTDRKKGSAFFWDVMMRLLAFEDGTERLFRDVGNYLLNGVALILHNSEDITPWCLLKLGIDRKEISASILTVENTVKDYK